MPLRLSEGRCRYGSPSPKGGIRGLGPRMRMVALEMDPVFLGMILRMHGEGGECVCGLRRWVGM